MGEAVVVVTKIFLTERKVVICRLNLLGNTVHACETVKYACVRKKGQVPRTSDGAYGVPTLMLIQVTQFAYNRGTESVYAPPLSLESCLVVFSLSILKFHD